MSLTITDQFCGAGGSSLGALAAGLDVRLALNHWPLAIETHAENFPDAGHDCADVSQTDPRRYPATDILLTSPECTAHSYAGGRSNRVTNPQLFEDDLTRRQRLYAERSRATMWDVPRFAEHHRYRAIVVENVVQARDWVMFEAWWQAMEALGYVGQTLSLNSMFFGACPQSRDRMYVVWTRKGHPLPDLDFRPPGVCTTCEQLVNAVQVFKRPDRPWGRYGAQYLYRCPTCATDVHPAYTPAAVAIDWSDLGAVIGDRDRPLADSTRARIRAGLDRYGYGNDPAEPRTPVTVLDVDGRPVAVPHALVMRNNTGGAEMSTPVDGPFRTVTTAGHQSLVVPVANGATPTTLEQAMGTQTTVDRFAFVATQRRHATLTTTDDPAATVAAQGNHHALVMANRHGGVPRTVDREAQTQTTGTNLALLVPLDRNYDGRDDLGSRIRTATEAWRTQTTRQTEAFATIPAGRVEVDDCTFRMFQPPEIGRVMAFPDHYIVHGTKRDQVKQYGNAVTPPVSTAITSRVAAACEVAA